MCVRACVRACVCVCMRAQVRASEYAYACAGVFILFSREFCSMRTHACGMLDLSLIHI